MDAIDLTIFAALAMVYAVGSGMLGRTILTPAIFFLTAGILFGDAVLGWLILDADGPTLRLIAETTLALVLFADASKINVKLLTREIAIPARLLGIGLPLTIAAGVAAALVVVPGLTVVEATLLAIAIAPTDAALGQAVVSDERVPSRVRQGLNVESGLNDGLCVPLLLIVLAFASAEGGGETEPVRLVLEEIGFGVVGGLAAASIGVAALRFGTARGWVASAWAPLVPLAITGMAYGLATTLHGSGLIAAFAAGLTFGVLGTARELETSEMVETVADGFSAATFLVFGAAIVPAVMFGFTWATLIFAVVALTLARMIPVAISLIGLHARLPTVTFIGWFGPRGLASIVFAVLILQAEPIPSLELLLATISLTIVVSVYAHGITARPLTQRYTAWLHANPRGDQLAAMADPRPPT